MSSGGAVFGQLNYFGIKPNSTLEVESTTRPTDQWRRMLLNDEEAGFGEFSSDNHGPGEKKITNSSGTTIQRLIQGVITSAILTCGDVRQKATVKIYQGRHREAQIYEEGLRRHENTAKAVQNVKKLS